MGSQSLKKKYVLDTCAWVWIAQGHARITKKIQEKLAKSEWLVPAISVWEVAMLVKKGRIEINCSLEQWIRMMLIEIPHLNLAHLTPEISVKSCYLTDYQYADPADRMIIATAICHHAVLVTGDTKIIEYCNAGHLSVMKI
jgi:PIN domain nuclease of toxin-antitoxin system